MQERLQKIVSRYAQVSRRKAEAMIAEGRISLNGEIVSRMGVKADPLNDTIRLDGKRIISEGTPLYILLHKPSGYVTTLRDPENRPVVTDLVKGEGERLFPVGRLDYDSEGLLLMTNDGMFAQKIQHPRYGVPKRYRVRVEGHLTVEEIGRLRKGVRFEDGFFQPRDLRIEKRNERSLWVSLTIFEGKNRMIRKGFTSLRHDVQRLVRVAIGDVQLGSLRRGMYRHLTKKEIDSLLSFSGRSEKIA
ncbi:MAG: pseudouridine synthase [Syntrophales bacterium]|jgi:23S rRNA pseudouridine2605 synthase|nr:pseudouridine synthase [Syntrophales bacterium]